MYRNGKARRSCTASRRRRRLRRSNPIPAALPALHAARDAEPDTTTRQFMTEAAGRREAAYAS